MSGQSGMRRWDRLDGSVNEIVIRGRVETLRRDALAVIRRAMEVVPDPECGAVDSGGVPSSQHSGRGRADALE